MSQQYIANQDIKFPDQRQYVKPGDLLVFNSASSSLTIYRGPNLVGTVHFSSSGLSEFIRLGWLRTPPAQKEEIPLAVGAEEVVPEVSKPRRSKLVKGTEEKND